VTSQGDVLEQWQRQRTIPPAADKPVPKRAQQVDAPPATRGGKRTGVLPLWLSEILILGLFGGLGYAILKLPNQLAAAMGALEKAIATLSAKISNGPKY